MLGPVNTLLDKMSKVWLGSEEWLNGCHVKKSEYHGSQFEENDSRKLLKNVDMLEELCLHEYHQFVNAFILFNDVVISCYGRNLLPQYKTSLSNFKDAYLKLNISDTPKVHLVFYHIEEFCSLKNMGLAIWSEQTTESLHQEFKKCWENYLVRDTEHPLYGERPLQAVQMFNSLNL